PRFLEYRGRCFHRIPKWPVSAFEYIQRRECVRDAPRVQHYLFIRFHQTDGSDYPVAIQSSPTITTRGQTMSSPDLHLAFGRARLDDRLVNELLGICRGVLADGHLALPEVQYIQKWLVANAA